MIIPKYVFNKMKNMNEPSIFFAEKCKSIWRRTENRSEKWEVGEPNGMNDDAEAIVIITITLRN